MTTGYCLNSTSQIQSSGYEGHFDNGAEIICCPLFIPKLWSPMQFPEPRQDNFIEWILIIVQGNSTLGVCGVKSKIGVVCSLILRFRYDLEKYFSIDTSLPPPARPSLTQAVLGLSRLARQCSVGRLQSLWKSLLNLIQMFLWTINNRSFSLWRNPDRWFIILKSHL